MNYIIIMGNRITCSIKYSLPPLQKKLFLTEENVVTGMEDMTRDTDQLWVSKEHRKREEVRKMLWLCLKLCY